MIHVRVGEDDAMQAPWRDGEVLPVQLLRLARPLEETAVHQDILVPDLQKVAGPRDGPAGAQELNLIHVRTFFRGPEGMRCS